MQLTPAQVLSAEDSLKKQKEPAVIQRPIGLHRTYKQPSPKWLDDAWFEKRYGDPDYYNRIKGLS